MPLEVSELASGDLGRYEALNRTSPHGSIWTSASWADYNSTSVVPYGAFRGSELVGGTLLPVSDGKVLRNVQGTPWMGLIARSSAEGESLEIAGRMAEVLGARYGEVTLTMPPEWIDLRAFIWRGWRQHVRYTYRVYRDDIYEKRLRLRPLNHRDIEQGSSLHKHTGDGIKWDHGSWRYADSEIDTLESHDFYHNELYYWKANRGGTWHAELIDQLVKVAVGKQTFVDLVGANGPTISLFKRSFAGRLTPYYAVSTSDVKDLRAESYVNAA